MNHLELRQHVARRLNQPLATKGAVQDIPRTLVFWTRQEVTDWLNEGYTQFWGELAQNEVQTVLTEGSGTYTAAARSMSLRTLLNITDDPLRIEEVRNITGNTTGSGVVLEYTPHQQFQSYMLDGSLLQRPVLARRRWSWFGFNPMLIEVFPAPTTALTLRIRYVPAQPLNPTSGTAPALRPDTADNATGDTDIPLAIPTSQHSLLVEYAVIKAYQKEENPSWQKMLTTYQEKLERFFAAINERQAQTGRSTFMADPTEMSFDRGRRYY